MIDDLQKIDDFFTILPGTKMTAQNAFCFDAIFCDGVFSKVAAKSILQNANAGNVTAVANGSYAATDAGARLVNVSVIQGLFSEVYCDTTSDPIRVHLVRY